MKIAIAGAGYVGLSNAVVLAQKNSVIVYDINKNKIDLLRQKVSPIVDKELQQFLKTEKLDLKFTCNPLEAFSDANFTIIATPTNYDAILNKFDVSSVYSIINTVKEINPNSWIVIKSTVGVGFTKNILDSDQFRNILFSPEFLREGKALYDNLFPSRIIVGVPSKSSAYLEKAEMFANMLAEGATKKDIDIKLLGSTEAEAVKLFANTYLALRVAYFNELDTFASSKGLDTLDIIKGVCSDPRIGDYYNNPSFGYGGYCLPKDTKELKANFTNISENLISAIVESNETRINFIVNEIASKSKRENFEIGIFRLTMKFGSDNFRESAVIKVMNSLREKGFKVVIYEPSYTNLEFDGFEVCNDLALFKKRSSIIVANRNDTCLSDVKAKIYSKDLFQRD